MTRDWATAGKILAGVVIGGILSGGCSPQVVERTVYVSQPVYVAQQVYVPQPVYVQQTVTYVPPCPVVYTAPCPVVYAQPCRVVYAPPCPTVYVSRSYDRGWDCHGPGVGHIDGGRRTYRGKTYGHEPFRRAQDGRRGRR